VVDTASEPQVARPRPWDLEKPAWLWPAITRMRQSLRGRCSTMRSMRSFAPPSTPTSSHRGTAHSSVATAAAVEIATTCCRLYAGVAIESSRIEPFTTARGASRRTVGDGANTLRTPG
jgi:hypothetical protein